MDIQGTVIGWILWRERWRLLEWTTFAQGRGMLGNGWRAAEKGGAALYKCSGVWRHAWVPQSPSIAVEIQESSAQMEARRLQVTLLGGVSLGGPPHGPRSPSYTATKMGKISWLGLSWCREG